MRTTPTSLLDTSAGTKTSPSRRIRHAARLFAAVAIGVIGATAVAAPASADIGLYDEEYYSGGWFFTAGDNINYDDGDRFNSNVLLNDEVESLVNYVPYRTCFYIDKWFAGGWFPVQPGVPQLSLGTLYNNELSSHNKNC